MIDDEELSICHKCVSDEFLRKEIQAEGKLGKCSYCKKTHKITKLAWLAQRIHSAIEDHFYLTSNEPTSFESILLNDKDFNYNWDRRGELVNAIIQDIAEVGEDVASDVQKYLSVYCSGNFMDSDEDPYGDEAYYEEYPPDKYEFQESWNSFCQEIRYRTRFFSQSAEKVLDGLFDKLDLLTTFDGKSAICSAGPDTENPVIFRARVAQLRDTLELILKNPVQELGAPPSRSSKHGRMNAAGISVFYGATDADTCIVEVRPPVGSHVVIGRFQIIREIRLLDLNILSQIYVKGSYFDPEFKGRIGHSAFLKSLVGELTKPVMPDEETFEYLPTQVVAEYLAKKVEPHLDGIIFDSSQTHGQGQNIILFHNSCGVDPYRLPKGTKVSIQHLWSIDVDDYDDSITVCEEIPGNSQGERPAPANETELQGDLFNYRDITLRLDVNKDIDVKVITGAEYKSRERDTSRYRTKKD